MSDSNMNCDDCSYGPRPSYSECHHYEPCAECTEEDSKCNANEDVRIDPAIPLVVPKASMFWDADLSKDTEDLIKLGFYINAGFEGVEYDLLDDGDEDSPKVIVRLGAKAGVPAGLFGSAALVISNFLGLPKKVVQFLDVVYCDLPQEVYNLPDLALQSFLHDKFDDIHVDLDKKISQIVLRVRSDTSVTELNTAFHKFVDAFLNQAEV